MCAASESCYIGTILQRNYKKMTIRHHFPIITLCYILIHVIVRCVVKELHSMTKSNVCNLHVQ